MRSAILLFHASQLGDNIHPFLINEVNHFKKRFDKVFVFCLEPSCSTSAIEDTNVHLVSVKLIPLYLHLWLIIPELFSRYFWEDVRIAIKNKVFDFKYLKITAMQIIYGRYFSRIAKKLIKQSPKDEWIIDSYWLTGPAYAAARIKKANNRVIAFSRLHSSEADVERNKYSICQMKGFIDNYLDYIFFVSSMGKDNYSHIMSTYYGMKIDSKKYIVNRLGVDKNVITGTPSSDDVFRILSCSRLVPLKRVPLLAEVFSRWKGKRIEWIHIGDGEEFEKVKSIITQCSFNQDAKCLLLGNLPHDEVIEYYRNNTIDAFINISMYEGLPVTIMEALSFGVPVIATNVGGTKELINPSNGVLLDRNVSEESIKAAVNSLIQLSKSDYLNMRKEAYKTYCDCLDSETNFNELIRVIENKEFLV